MKRSLIYMFFGVVVLVAYAETATANNLLINGDIETESRFAPHGTPGVDHPNGYPDGWHHSSNASWSNGTTDPASSPTHSLSLPDDNAGGLANVAEEHRSFATALPGVGNASRTLDLSWNWNWDITSLPTDTFSATVRISDGPVISLDLIGNITDHVFQTGTGNSGGFQAFVNSIPLSPSDASFDIIFKTEDRVGDSSETGTFFIDDVIANVPEPTSVLLLSIAGLMALSRRQRV